jgi:hypothetical protein
MSSANCLGEFSPICLFFLSIVKALVFLGTSCDAAIPITYFEPFPTDVWEAFAAEIGISSWGGPSQPGRCRAKRCGSGISPAKRASRSSPCHQHYRITSTAPFVLLRHPHGNYLIAVPAINSEIAAQLPHFGGAMNSRKPDQAYVAQWHWSIAYRISARSLRLLPFHEDCDANNSSPVMRKERPCRGPRVSRETPLL